MLYSNIQYKQSFIKVSKITIKQFDFSIISYHPTQHQLNILRHTVSINSFIQLLKCMEKSCDKMFYSECAQHSFVYLTIYTLPGNQHPYFLNQQFIYVTVTFCHLVVQHTEFPLLSKNTLQPHSENPLSLYNL